MKYGNHYTTSEMGKKLLELGLPLNSADCVRVVETGTIIVVPEDRKVEYYVNKYNDERCVKAEPCWSVGRLIDIVFICWYGQQEFLLNKQYHNIEAIVNSLERYLNFLDFSILED